MTCFLYFKFLPEVMILTNIKWHKILLSWFCKPEIQFFQYKNTIKQCLRSYCKLLRIILSSFFFIPISFLVEIYIQSSMGEDKYFSLNKHKINTFFKINHAGFVFCKNFCLHWKLVITSFGVGWRKMNK